MFKATNSNAIISKSKNIFWIFFCISGIYKTFGILWKKIWASEVFFFWSYKLQIMVLLKCWQGTVSEDLRTTNMLKGPKDCLYRQGSFFLIFLLTLKGNELEKICFSTIWNPETVCYHIDNQWQAFYLSKS